MRTVVLVGHVDHGKTALAAQLCAAWGEPDVSRLDDAEEKERSKTREFAQVVTPRGWTLLDTPEHKRFVRRMVAGLFQEDAVPDVAVVVVSAAGRELDQALQGGQLLEQLTLVRCSGVPSVVAWINKMDRVPAARAAEVERALAPHLHKLRFARVAFLSGSAATGQGVRDLVALVERQPPRPPGPDGPTGPSVVTDHLKMDVQLFEQPGTFLTAGGGLVLHGPRGEKRQVEVQRCHPPRMRGQARGSVWVRVVPPWAVQVGGRVVLRTAQGTLGLGRIT